MAENSRSQGSSARDAAAILAHTGFLNGARALSSSASKRIQAFLSGPGRQPDGLGRKPHVLFTGHSAGGAVASLLFRHFLSKQEYGRATAIPQSGLASTYSSRASFLDAILLYYLWLASVRLGGARHVRVRTGRRPRRLPKHH